MLKREIVEGYWKFRSEIYPKLARVYRRLAQEGQNPSTLVITCVDSRVDPGKLLSAGPGEVFIARNVANIVPPFSAGGGHSSIGAVVEFAVLQLNVDTIIVLGHGKCGGIAALLGGEEGPRGEAGYVHNWMGLARTARDKVLSELPDAPDDERLKALEEENVRLGLRNLMTYPWVKERVDAGTLEIVGGHFDIEDGILFHCTLEQDTFEPVV